MVRHKRSRGNVKKFKCKKFKCKKLKCKKLKCKCKCNKILLYFITIIL